MDTSHNKICVFSLGVAIGITWAIGIFIMGLLAWGMNYGTNMVDVFGTVYIGYTPTPKGIIIGTVWALIDGFIAGVLIAWIYNLCISCVRKK